MAGDLARRSRQAPQCRRRASFISDHHLAHPTARRLSTNVCSALGVAAVLARHPGTRGGGEAYLQRIGAQLAIGHCSHVAHRLAIPVRRHELVDGVRISRAGGRYSVSMGVAGVAAARCELGPLRRCARIVASYKTAGRLWPSCCMAGGRWYWYTGCHRERGRWADDGRLGWYVESMLSPRLYRRNQYVTVSLPSARGQSPRWTAKRIAVVRNGVDGLRRRCRPVRPTPRVVVLSRLVPHKADRGRVGSGRELASGYQACTLEHRRRWLVAARLVDHNAPARHC